MHTSACAARLKSFNLPNLWGLDTACATPAGKGPLAERRSNCNVQYCMELPQVDGCEGPLPCAGSLDFLEHRGPRLSP